MNTNKLENEQTKPSFSHTPIVNTHNMTRRKKPGLWMQFIFVISHYLNIWIWIWMQRGTNAEKTNFHPCGKVYLKRKMTSYTSHHIISTVVSVACCFVQNFDCSLLKPGPLFCANRRKYDFKLNEVPSTLEKWTSQAYIFLLIHNLGT